MLIHPNRTSSADGAVSKELEDQILDEHVERDPLSGSQTLETPKIGPDLREGGVRTVQDLVLVDGDQALHGMSDDGDLEHVLSGITSAAELEVSSSVELAHAPGVQEPDLVSLGQVGHVDHEVLERPRGYLRGERDLAALLAHF